MSLFDDLLAAMMTTEPGARHAIREAGRALDANEATQKELTALRREVASLQRIVAMLAHAVAEGEASDVEALRDRLLSVARSGSPDDQPSASLLRCAACHELIDPSEPALKLRKVGRVCAVCFERGGVG